MLLDYNKLIIIFIFYQEKSKSIKSPKNSDKRFEADDDDEEYILNKNKKTDKYI
jgi:hypothetical protein